MKTNKILTLISVAAVALLSSCAKEITPQNPYVRNTGEELLTVDKDTLEFPGRGSTLTFVASCTYDSDITAPDWLELTSTQIPGDGREFTVSVTAEANLSLDGATDRSGLITITSKTLTEKIYVSQPLYVRPDCPMTISSVAEFRDFIEVCAPYYEADEVVEVLADIDLDGVSLSRSAETFKGQLNCNGFKLKNWKDSLALFAKNEGVIDNLVLDESCTLTVPSSSSEIFFSPFVAKNYGTISGCTNGADIVLDGNYNRTNVGAFAACNYESGLVTKCVNKGEIKFAAVSGKSTVFLGGIVGYNYNKSSITDCESYGPITCVPAAFSSTYQAGGIVGHHNSSGDLSGNIVHKEALISTNEISGSGKSYLGGIVGNMDTAPKTSGNQVYADLEINLKVECYIGGLQAFQGGVNDAANPSVNCFEGSIVNSNITAWKKGTSKNGNNVCLSAGLVVGRFTGQKGKATTLHYGTADNPIKASGSITCLETGTKKVAAPKDYQAMLVGDGSTSSISTSPITECDFNNISYKVCGDGQTGDAEDMVVKTDKVKLSVEPTGGEATFTVRGNYTMTITPEVDWITSDVETVAGDGEYHEITLTAVANDHTYEREGTVAITMPMGSTEIVTVSQAGNKTLPESLEVTPETIEADPAGTAASKFDVTSNYDATLTASDDWIILGQETVVGDEAKHSVTVNFEKNQTGAARQGTITITLPKGESKTVVVNQEKFVYVPKTEIGTVDDFLDLMAYGNDPGTYPATFTVKLTADIDLKGKTFEPVSEFVATLDGQNHSLKNWASTAPLFTDLKGKVANLKIDATCSTSASVCIAYIASNNNGTIENCTNNAAVKVTTAAATGTRITSFAAYNFGTIKGCTNNGAITYEPDSTPGQAIYLAGITCTLNGGTVENCTNNAKVAFAPVAVTAKAYQRVGGIASICVKNNYATIKGCVNTKNAPISITDPSGLITNAYAGNIVGEIEAKGVSVLENCTAFGDVTTNVRNDNSQIGGIAGKIGKYGVATTLMNGCSVNCNITGVFKTTKTPVYNFLNSCGMIAGRLGGESASAPLSLGSVENPVNVSGTINMTASEGVEAQSVTISADNFGKYAVGNGSGVSTTSGAAGQVINAKYEVVTKQ